MIKTLNKLGIEETYLKIVKATYEKPTANIMRKESYLPKIRNKTKMPTLPLLLYIILEVLARAIRQGKEKKASKLERKKEN